MPMSAAAKILVSSEAADLVAGTLDVGHRGRSCVEGGEAAGESLRPDAAGKIRIATRNAIVRGATSRGRGNVTLQARAAGAARWPWWRAACRSLLAEAVAAGSRAPARRAGRAPTSPAPAGT